MIHTKKTSLVNRFPFYYGWVILAVGSLGMIMTSPGQTFSASIFIQPIIEDLGISRSLISILYTIGTLIGSLSLPLVGRMIDSRGPRLMLSVIAGLFGLACIYMGSVQNAWMLGIGFIATRMLGQGSLGLVSQNVINQWWVRRRGTVMGLSGVLMALLGVGGFPNLINWLIPLVGWRLTYAILGLMLLLIMMPLAIILLRDRPEDYGLKPDGGQIDAGDSLAPEMVFGENSWTLKEAMRVPVFWVVALGLSSISMLGTGLFFHMVSIFEDNGLTATIAASVFVPVSLTSAVVNLGGGFLLDRMPVRILLAISLFLLALALYLAEVMTGVQTAILYGIVLGASTALMGLLNSVVWAAYFGRKYLGSITGVTTTIVIAGSALGPMPLGIARDLLGSYNLALTISAILPLGLGVASLFFGKPNKSRNDPTQQHKSERLT